MQVTPDCPQCLEAKGDMCLTCAFRVPEATSTCKEDAICESKALGAEFPVEPPEDPLRCGDHYLTDEQVEFFYENGYLVIPDVITDERSNAAIKEIWDLLTGLPRKPGSEIKIPQGLDVRGEIPNAVIKEWSSKWVPHKQFGAPMEAPIMHLKTIWENRQDPAIYCKFMQLLDTQDLWVGINRLSVKLPGAGETEFIHLDSDPWFWQDSEPILQGMLFFEPGTFLGVPGTHTEEFGEEFTEAYTYLKPKGKKPKAQAKVAIKLTPPVSLTKKVEVKTPEGKRQKYKTIPKTEAELKQDRVRYALEKKVNDPLDLEGKLKTIHVPKNALLVWSSRMFHAAQPNKTKRMRYAQYIGFRVAGSIPKLGNPVLGLTERMDRIRSYYEGKSVYHWPSGDKVHFMPAKWANFPKIPAHYQRLLPDPLDKQTRITKAGKEVAEIREYDPKVDRLTHPYRPPRLSPLGKKLLGLSVPDQKNKTEEDQKVELIDGLLDIYLDLLDVKEEVIEELLNTREDERLLGIEKLEETETTLGEVEEELDSYFRPQPAELDVSDSSSLKRKRKYKI